MAKTEGKDRQLGFLARTICRILAVVLICLAVAAVFSMTSQKETGDRIEFSKGWDISVNGKHYYDEDLDTFQFPDEVKRGDIITLENTLPYNTIMTNATLRFEIYLSAVSVRVGGQEIYHYGFWDLSGNHLVGSGIHFVHLPTYCQGKTIRITLFPAEDDAFTYIPAGTLSYTSQADAQFMRTAFLPMVCGIFLMVLGLILTVAGLFGTARDRIYSRLVLIGTFSFLVGLWSAATGRFIQLFSGNMRLNTLIEYPSLFFALVPFLLLLYLVRRPQGGLFAKTALILFWISLSFACLTVVCHVTNLRHYPGFVGPFQLMVVLFVIVLVLVELITKKKRKKPRKDEKIIHYAMIAVVLFAVFDVLRFNFQKYVFGGRSLLNVSVFPLGVLIFVILLLVSYLVYVSSVLMNRREREVLTELAYHDPLTGIGNRAESERAMSELSRNNSRVYTMISFDLNYLKRANDQYGHAVGDSLLKGFARALNTVFREHGTVIRMGGDEFLVILPFCDGDRIRDLLLRFLEAEKKGGESLPVPMDASFGVAMGPEIRENDPERVYRLADDRMYRMKEQSHKGRR